MAIFYKHIKGTTNAKSNTTGLWTGLSGANQKQNPAYKNLEETPSIDEFINIDASQKAECLPTIYITNQNVDSETTTAATSQKYNLGHILTSDAIDQKINTPLTIKQSLLGKAITQDYAEGILTVNKQYQMRGADQEPDEYLFQMYSSGITILNQTIRFHNFVESQGYLDAKTGEFVTKNHIIVGDTSNAIDGQYVQAPYFNATSDIRAKDNLVPLSTNALDIIKKVQVYTFNYKNNPEERTIGVIAQEFLDKKLDNVSLVANEGASGENGDYMSIKETKLIYLLLKGMQEQQAEIDDLKQQIKKLESK